MKLFLFAIFFFVDPLIFYRVFIPNDYASIVVSLFVILIVLIFVLKSISLRSLNIERLRVLILVMIFYVSVIAVRLSIGQSGTSIIQISYVFMQSVFILVLVKSANYHTIFIKSYLCASYLHLVTIIPFFTFISEKLTLNTAYPVGEYAIGIFDRRATGFFNAPGQLSLFASGGLAIGLSLIKNRNYKKIGLNLVVVCSLLGFASFSRSFLVVFIFLLLFYFILTNYKTKLYLISIFFFLIVMLSFNETFVNYVDYIYARLSMVSDFSNNDRIVGETGIIPTLQLISDQYHFGAALLDNGSLKAWDGTMFLRPHVGVLAVLSFYGVIYGGSILYLIARAHFNIVFSRRKSSLMLKDASIHSSFIAGFIIVNIVCLVEPLIETGVYMFFLLGVLNFYISTSRSNIIIKNPKTPEVRKKCLLN